MTPNHILYTTQPAYKGTQCKVVKGKTEIANSYQNYLMDESKLRGETPDKIYFPRTTAEVSQALTEINIRGEKVTVSGRRTGLVGGAVPIDCSNLLSLESLFQEPNIYFDECNKCWCVSVGAGTSMEYLHQHLEKCNIVRKQKDWPPFFYPVDPTERSASIGGNAATNASGSRTFRYGSTRDWVAALTIVLSDGSTLAIKRGHKYAKGNSVSLIRQHAMQTISLPVLSMPVTKNAAGYFLKENMDLLDLFIAGEGTLGVITELDLKLCAPPQNQLCVYVFLSLRKCLDLVRLLKQQNELQLLAIEFMDDKSLNLLKAYRKETGASSGVPLLTADSDSAVYVEIEYANDAVFEKVVELFDKLLHEVGISIDSTWAGSTTRDFDAMKRFRHALPERINTIISERKQQSPLIHKVAADTAVPDFALKEALTHYQSTLRKTSLDYCIFGHIGNGHLHINILPEDNSDVEKGLELCETFANLAVPLGGSVTAEHGIGKLKKNLLKIQYSEATVAEMAEMKKSFDPFESLNPGVMF